MITGALRNRSTAAAGAISRPWDRQTGGRQGLHDKACTSSLCMRPQGRVDHLVPLDRALALEGGGHHPRFGEPVAPSPSSVQWSQGRPASMMR